MSMAPAVADHSRACSCVLHVLHVLQRPSCTQCHKMWIHARCTLANPSLGSSPQMWVSRSSRHTRRLGHLAHGARGQASGRPVPSPWQWPIVGHLPSFMARNQFAKNIDMERIHTSLYRDFGAIYRLNLPGHGLPHPHSPHA